MVKSLLTGMAQPVEDINERLRNLFKDKPEFSPKPAPERKNFRRPAKAEPEPAEEVEQEAVEDEMGEDEPQSKDTDEA
jgi:hypothetical protein